MILCGNSDTNEVAVVLHSKQSGRDIQKEVERAFAKTMADRDHAAFESFLSKEAVADNWKAYFTESEPPFPWKPETVSVLDSGKLAISTGPVWNAEGRRTSTYTSIWRQEEPGVWRIIFDKGNKYCE